MKLVALYVGVTPALWVWSAIGAIWYAKSAVSTCLPMLFPAPLVMTVMACGFLVASVLWFKGLLDARDWCRSAPMDDSLALIYQRLPPIPEAIFNEKAYSEGLKSEVCTICYEEFKVNTMQKGEKVAELRTCAHCFHRNCVSQWLQRKPICPYCQTSVY